MELRLGKYRIQIEREYDIDGTMPKIYNAEGHPLETYFIKNRHSRHAPFGMKGSIFSGTGIITGWTRIFMGRRQ